MLYPGRPGSFLIVRTVVQLQSSLPLLIQCSNSMFKFQCQEKPENSVYFSFIHFHMTKLKDQDDSKLQFQKVGVPLLKFYNKQLD